MPLVALLAGALFGMFADRFAARWPAHTAPMPEVGAAAEVDPAADMNPAAATSPAHAMSLAAAQTPLAAMNATAVMTPAAMQSSAAVMNPATMHFPAAHAPAAQTRIPAAAQTVAGPAVIRRVDWRTVFVGLLAAASFAGLLLRWSDPRDVAVLGVYFAALIVLAATDLDQKLLPDVITFPLIGYALVILLIGWNPLLADKSMGFVSGIAAGLGAPILLLVTDRIIGGGLGMGDIKLAVALGLMSGVSLLFAGFLIASAASSVVLIALIVSRRVGLRSAIPFGPILICAGIVAALLP